MSLDTDKLHMQIVAINDAIQILARSNVTVNNHEKEIGSLLQKQGTNEERLREIENLIHQSCELKTKEMNDQEKAIGIKLEKIEAKAHDYAWKYSAAIASVTLAFFYYVFSVIGDNSREHTEFERTQDAKADKIYNEIFDVLRDVRTTMSDLKADVAVLTSKQENYQTILHTHMQEEEKALKGNK